MLIEKLKNVDLSSTAIRISKNIWHPFRKSNPLNVYLLKKKKIKQERINMNTSVQPLLQGKNTGFLTLNHDKTMGQAQIKFCNV